ncbi:MAG: diguanylate cyclase (GGDEF)-like protein [Oceanicoccus sp.]|jgi:diguanylate cyclase (GGDEF)-like protein
MKRFLYVLLFCCLYALNATAELSATSYQQVLLLNSYHPQYAWTHHLTNGVTDTLLSQISPENIHVEYMDARRFVDDRLYNKYIKDILHYKYQKYKPDLIITSDDYAYRFMLENRDDLFPATPIVFCGVNVFMPSMLVGVNNITGILEGMEIGGNLRLIKQLQPDVERIILLGDATGLGLKMVRRAREILKTWDDKTTIYEIWDSFSLNELYESVAILPNKTAVLMLAVHKDKLGQYFSFGKEFKELTKKSTVPVYGMWGALMIGNGGVGGLINDPYEHGKDAATMALKILSGTSIDTIKIQPKATFNPIFDYDVLKKFRINLNRLPENSMLINKPVSVYQSYKKEINWVLAVLLLMVVVINILLLNIRKRIQIKVQLDDLNKSLEDSVIARTRELDQRNKELIKAHRLMEELAHTDALTGLGNRRAGNDEINAYINRMHRDNHPISVFLLDIDFFKKVNDSFGHNVGDDVLLEFSKILRRCVRPSDRVYRWGGEEFLVLLPNTDLEFAKAVCNRVMKDLSNFQFDHVGKITASIGVAVLEYGDDMNSFLKRADDLLYKAKNNGRDQVVSA